jgi:hypothetical protein
MPLQLPPGSRFEPHDGTETITQSVISEFDALIRKVAAQGDRQDLIEHFKGFFCGAIGAAHYRSSSESWAHSDLATYMQEIAGTPALFLEAFYDACEALRANGKYEVPSIELVNEILRRHHVNFEVRPPRLVRIDDVPRVPHPDPPISFADDAAAIIRASMQRAEALLSQNRPREAVQEMLWILESIATTFRGVELKTGTVHGRYFNDIARELRAASKGKTLDRVAEWSIQLQGYLSSPTGGGVRHGIDLMSGDILTFEEGRLFCNLILSYVTYFMAEHAKLTT